MVVRAAAYILTARRRSLSHDALVAVRAMPKPPVALDTDLVPRNGSFVIVGNHYERPGLWMAWPAVFVSRVIAETTGHEVRWIAIQEWEDFSLLRIHIPRGLIRRLFERAFGTYGIIPMAPPDAPRAARAASMRAAVEELRRGQVLGLMPEGTVGSTPELLAAREGAGSFLLLLAATGAQILPVGLYEKDDSLVARFGEPFELKPPNEVARDERDTWARHATMHAIRDLLPAELWGVYGDKDAPSAP